MIHLIVAFSLLIILTAITRRIWHYPSYKALAAMLAFGVIAGLFMDYFIGYKMGLWSYTHHSYWFPDYFMYLIPAWALVITLFILSYSIIEKLIKNVYIRLTIYFALIPLQQEFMGAWQQSWSYNAPLGVMICGWVLLLAACILVKHALDWFGAQTIEITYYKAEVPTLKSV